MTVYLILLSTAGLCVVPMALMLMLERKEKREKNREDR